jgi:hypothetical protein
MTAAERLKRIERIAVWVSKHPKYIVIHKICKEYSITAGAARKLYSDAGTLIQARYDPKELNAIKAQITQNLEDRLKDPTLDAKAAAVVAKVLNQMLGFNAPLRVEHTVEAPLYPLPEEEEDDTAADSP